MSASLLVQYGEKRRGKCFTSDLTGTTLELTHDYIQTFMDHSRTLDNSLEALLDTELTSSGLNALDTAKTASTYLKQLVEDLWLQIPITSKPTPKAALKATEVFGVPELLECILLKLGTHDILTAQQTNKDFRDAVNDSVKLKWKLGLEPDPSGHTYSPFHKLVKICPTIFQTSENECFPGIKFESRTCHYGPKVDNDYPVMVRFARSYIPKTVGSRYRAMLMFQPPVKELELSVLVRKSNATARMNHRITKEDGITLGDILDAMNMNATPEKEGKIVTFKHKFVLKDSDPIMVARRLAFEEERVGDLSKAREYGWHNTPMRNCLPPSEEERAVEDDYYNAGSVVSLREAKEKWAEEHGGEAPGPDDSFWY